MFSKYTHDLRTKRDQQERQNKFINGQINPTSLGGIKITNIHAITENSSLSLIDRQRLIQKQQKTETLRQRSQNRVQKFFSQLDSDAGLLSPIIKAKPEPSLKQAMDNHLFRDRNHDKEIQPLFKGPNYFNQHERIEKALKQAELYDKEKFLAKSKFVFRAAQPLKGSPKPLRYKAQLETERVADLLANNQKFETQSFNLKQMKHPNIHRSETRNNWIGESGFNQATQFKTLDSPKQNFTMPPSKDNSPTHVGGRSSILVQSQPDPQTMNNRVSQGSLTKNTTPMRSQSKLKDLYVPQSREPYFARNDATFLQQANVKNQYKGDSIASFKMSSITPQKKSQSKFDDFITGPPKTELNTLFESYVKIDALRNRITDVSRRNNKSIGGTDPNNQTRTRFDIVADELKQQQLTPMRGPKTTKNSGTLVKNNFQFAQGKSSNLTNDSKMGINVQVIDDAESESQDEAGKNNFGVVKESCMESNVGSTKKLQKLANQNIKSVKAAKHQVNAQKLQKAQMVHLTSNFFDRNKIYIKSAQDYMTMKPKRKTADDQVNDQLKFSEIKIIVQLQSR